jgi:uncharacterized protein YigA (DUF484 family)
MNKEEEIKRVNEEIAERFSRIEAKLSAIHDFAGLFETLFTSIEEEFGVPFVWLSLIDTESNAKIIAALKLSAPLRNRLSVVKPELLEEIFSAGYKPFLVNENLRPYFKLFPSSNKYFIKSLAIVPLQINEKIVGSWNNGDALANRYSPEMETGLLEKFAQMISRRLTEINESIDN